jgi:hypothetical protein
MVKLVFLKIILSLKSTFDIFLFCKINFQQYWIKIYECLQGKMPFADYYEFAYIIWINKIK